jgi:cytidine deaminase
MNEVPRRGGGFYWGIDSPDGRDQWLMAWRKQDRAKDIKISALVELIGKIRKQDWLNENVKDTSVKQLADELLPKLKGTQFMDIGEFMRPVHAEMAALIDSARRGVAVHGLTMYVTTFPCHNCAKHIIAAGLRKVVYLEPYPKSRANELHGEEINLYSIDGKEQDDKLVFCAFTGVGPRQYQRVFSMSARGRKTGLALKEWHDACASLPPTYIPRNAAAAYLLTECQELEKEKLPTNAYKWDPKTICPSSNSG